MAKVREKQLQKRKQETLEVAIRLLMERGYANLNMDELAEEVGISKPTLYQYFNSKDDLLAEALIQMMQKMQDQFSESSEKSPLEQLEQFLRTMIYGRYKKQDMIGQVNMDVMRSIFHGHPDLRQHMAGTRDKLIQIVKKGQEVGEIDPSIRPWVVVNLMFSLQGIVNHPFAKDDPQRSDEEILEAIDSIIRMFRRSVSVPMPEHST